MIKHAGRLIIAFILILIVTGWLLKRYLDETLLTGLLWIVYVASPILALLIKERRRGARPGVITLLATLVAATVSSWILYRLDTRWWIRYLLLAVAATPLMSIANAAFRADIRRAQRRRDAHATHLAQAVLAGEQVERFILYLRPFVSTDRLMAQPLPSEFQPSEIPLHLDVETLLARTFRKTVPVIALGKSGDTMEGAARVTVSDDDWQKTVEALARQAEFIAMVPLSRPGTMWELEWLKQSDLLKKVLFIMPENPHQAAGGVISTTEPDDRIFEAGLQIFDASAHMLDLAKEWLDAERSAAKFGLQFPPFAAVGALYTVNPETGEVKDILPLALSTIARRIYYLRTSVMLLGLLPASEALPNFHRHFMKSVLWGGRTLENALVWAADGFVVWGDAVTATSLIQRAFEVGKPQPVNATGYLNSLPLLIEDRLRVDHIRAARRYVDFARQARTDSLMGSVITNETLQEIDRISATLPDGSRQHVSKEVERRSSTLDVLDVE